MIICNIVLNDVYTQKTFHYIWLAIEGYALLPNVDMCNGCLAQQEYGAAFSKNSVFAGF